jgi:hypothetical protein
MGAGAHRVDNAFPGRLGQSHVGNDPAVMENEDTVGHLERLIYV